MTSGEGKGAKIKDDWIIINKDYSSQRYVDLDQITPANVSGLNEVCEIQLNEPIWFSSGILKVGRTLYVSTSRVTYAFDAATCDLRWRYVIDYKQVPANNNNRGPGYLDGKISRGTGDGRVIGSMPRPARCYGTRWARQTLPNMKPSIRPRLPGRGKCLSASLSAIRA